MFYYGNEFPQLRGTYIEFDNFRHNKIASPVAARACCGAMLELSPSYSIKIDGEWHDIKIADIVSKYYNFCQDRWHFSTSFMWPYGGKYCGRFFQTSPKGFKMISAFKKLK